MKSARLIFDFRYRFPSTLYPLETTQELKKICEEKIAKCLSIIKFTRKRSSHSSLMEVTQSTDPTDLSTLASPSLETEGLASVSKGEEPIEEDEDEEDTEIEDSLKGYARNSGRPRCHRCGSSTHLIRECPLRKRCHRCDGIDHIAKECTAPIRRRSAGPPPRARARVREATP